MTTKLITGTGLQLLRRYDNRSESYRAALLDDVSIILLSLFVFVYFPSFCHSWFHLSYMWNYWLHLRLQLWPLAIWKVFSLFFVPWGLQRSRFFLSFFFSPFFCATNMEVDTIGSLISWYQYMHELLEMLMLHNHFHVREIRKCDITVINNKFIATQYWFSFVNSMICN